MEDIYLRDRELFSHPQLVLDFQHHSHGCALYQCWNSPFRFVCCCCGCYLHPGFLDSDWIRHTFLVSMGCCGSICNCDYCGFKCWIDSRTTISWLFNCRCCNWCYIRSLCTSRIFIIVCQRLFFLTEFSPCSVSFPRFFVHFYRFHLLFIS